MFMRGKKPTAPEPNNDVHTEPQIESQPEPKPKTPLDLMAEAQSEYTSAENEYVEALDRLSALKGRLDSAAAKYQEARMAAFRAARGAGSFGPQVDELAKAIRPNRKIEFLCVTSSLPYFGEFFNHYRDWAGASNYLRAFDHAKSLVIMFQKTR